MSTFLMKVTGLVSENQSSSLRRDVSTIAIYIDLGIYVTGLAVCDFTIVAVQSY